MLSRAGPVLTRPAAAAARSCVSSTVRPSNASLRWVSSHQPNHHRAAALLAPSGGLETQKATKNKPLQGVPIEHVTTATEVDSTLTLGECASRDVKSHASFTNVSIGNVLSAKTHYGGTLHTVKSSESVATSLQLMNHYNIGAILVTSDDDTSSIVGIFSTRDFLKHINADATPIDVKNMKVEELMSHDPVFAYSDTNALAAMNMMNSGGFRHLPIRDRTSNRTIGIVSIGDLVRTMMKDYEERNSFLHDLVHGGYSA